MKRIGMYNEKIPDNAYKCPDCGTTTFEGDRYHYTIWDSKGGHCIVNGKQIN